MRQRASQTQTSPYAYVETDSDTVTFVSGLHVGASVKFTTSQLNTSGAVDAEQVSYTPPFTGSVATNVEEKLSQTVSVKDFGATGDGITDDAAAIQNALDSGAASVYIPAGYYKAGTTLNVPTTVKKIYGDGGGSIIYSDTPNGDYLLELDSAYILLQDFVLYGYDLINATPPYAPTLRNGINANVAGDRGHWQNILIAAFDIGAFVGTTTAATYMQKFDHCDFSICNTGMRVEQGMHQSTWINCVFRSNVNYGLLVTPTNTNSEIVAGGIYNCTFERTVNNAGLALINVRGFDVSACYFEQNQTTSVILQGSASNACDGVSIHNCYFFHSADVLISGHGIEFGANVINTVIENNHFEAYNVAGQYPIKISGFSGFTTSVNNNLFNNCTGNTLQIYSDFGYFLNQNASLVNQSIMHTSALLDSSGNLASTNIGYVCLANNTASLIVRVTTSEVSNNVSTKLTTTTNYIRFFVSGGAIVATVDASTPTGFTFSVGTSTTAGTGYFAPINVVVSGATANCNVGIDLEIAYSSNSSLFSNSVITGTYS
jgi:hypothetical protein